VPTRCRASDLLPREEIKADTDWERAQAQAMINGKFSIAERRIAEAKAKALVNVEGIALNVAGTIVTHLIGKAVSKADVERARGRRADRIIVLVMLRSPDSRLHRPDR
jgi:hypothetical protein